MRKPIIALASTLLSLAAIYLVIVAFIGSRVSSELGDYEAMLVARDDVRVVRFDYTRGFFNGELSVELNWRPLPGEEFYQVFAGVPNIDSEGISLAGGFNVQHGPWLGSAGLGLAKIDQQIQAPQQLRDALPQYPGQTPVLELVSVLDFRGDVRTDYSVIDYIGRVVVGNESADLQLAGLRGSFETNSQFTQMNGAFELQQARIGLPNDVLLILEDISGTSLTSLEENQWRTEFDSSMQRLALESAEVNTNLENYTLNGVIAGRGQLQDFTTLGLSSLTQLQLELALGDLGFALNESALSSNFQLSGVNLDIDLTEDESTAMLGSTDFGFTRAAFNLPQENAQGEVGDFSASGIIERRGDVLDNTGSLSFKQVIYNGQPLGGMAMESSLHGMNIESYVVFENFSDSGADADTSELELQALMDAVQRLAADQLTFTLDRLVFFLPSQEDISATMNLAYNGSPQINWQSYDELIAALSMDASLHVSLSAIDRLMVSAGLAPEQHEQYRAMLQEVAKTPYVTVTGDIMSSSLVLRQGEILINDEPVMSAPDLLALAEGAGSSFSSETTGTQMSAEDFAEPLYGHVELQADFQPDPYTVELLAGGEQDAAAFDFSCSGNINAQQPDVRISYTAGDYALFMYAESAADTTLVLLGPEGWLCDDDGYRDLHPAVVIAEPQSGEYLVWVGTYETEPGEATLFVSEVDPR